MESLYAGTESDGDHCSETTLKLFLKERKKCGKRSTVSNEAEIASQNNLLLISCKDSQNKFE